MGKLNNDNIIKRTFRFLTNRLLIMFIIFCLMFYILFMRLFQLQIVEGETYLNSLVFTTQRKLTIPAPRGTIYDRYGRPLAVNLSAYTVRIDPSVQVDNINEMLYELIKVFERHGQEYVDELPLSKDEPFTFMFGSGDAGEAREKLWKRDMDIKQNLDAEECFYYLREEFKIDPEMDNIEARKIIQLRSMLHLQRYRQYKPITIAYDVSRQLVITLEERNRDFPGVYIDVESLREYPYGDLYSHIIGWIRGISAEDLERNKGKGYTDTDLYGQTGIERSFEPELKGVNGEMVVEIDIQGRRVRTNSVTEPIQGDKIFLTLDTELQQVVTESLTDTLTEILINKLQGKSSKEAPITLKDFYSSILKGNTISIKEIMESELGSYSFNIREYVLRFKPDADENYSQDEDKDDIKTIITDGIVNGQITSLQMLFTLYEQQVITLQDDYVELLKNGRLSVLTVLVEKLTEGEITPQMTSLDPCTGSAIVVDVKTGDVLASVAYPTYDTNEFVNSFNNAYWYDVNSDPTLPMTNRPFLEPRAPGSTFKMLTGITALEMGAIKPTTTVYDARIFTEAGWPYAKCYSSYSHGLLNVSTALEVSCNFFFSDAAYRIGNAKSGTEKESINALNDYMTMFGFNDRTGVEIVEYRDVFNDEVVLIAGPANREYTKLRWYPDALPSDYAWYDGDTVRVAFGQGDNNYTAANMAKYIAMLATGGTRMQMHFLDKVETQTGETVRTFEPVVETAVEMVPENLQAIYKGMLLVTEGQFGTARGVFSGFPVRVAGKTGTAQEIEGRPDHSSFGGFAPYDDPEIAVYVLIPFGDTYTLLAPAAQVAKKVFDYYLNSEIKPEISVFNNGLAK